MFDAFLFCGEVTNMKFRGPFVVLLMHILVIYIFDTYGVEAVQCTEQPTVITIPSGERFFNLELKGEEFRTNMFCRWIVRHADGNRIIKYNLVKVYLRHSYRCTQRYLRIRKDYEGLTQKMCGYFRGRRFEGNSRPRYAREWTVEFKTNETATARAGIKVAFTVQPLPCASKYNWPKPWIQVENEYRLMVTQYEMSPSCYFNLRANNPKNQLSFKFEKLDTKKSNDCEEDFVSISPKSNNNKDDAKIFCGKLEGNPDYELMTNSPPSDVWRVHIKMKSFRQKEGLVSILFKVIGDEPTLNEPCMSEPMVLTINSEITLNVSRSEVIEANRGDSRFHCRWIFRPADSLKKLSYRIEMLDLPYKESIFRESFWYEYLSIYPDYFTDRRPHMAGNMENKLAMIDSTRSDLRSTSPVKQLNVDYQVANYYFYRGTYRGFTIRITLE